MLTQKNAFHLQKGSVAILLAALFILILNSKMFLLALLIILDHILLRFKIGYNMDLPVDSVFIGMSILSYYAGLAYGVGFIAHGFVARIVYGKYESSHVYKQPLLLLAASVIFALKSMDFAIIATLSYLGRYLMEYMAQWAISRSISLERLTTRALNIITASIVFISIDNILAFF